MAGPQYYLPADRETQWFADTYPGARFTGLDKVVIHTTETRGWPGYQEGATAPNLTCRPDFVGRRLVWRQHFRCLESSRALRNPAGGVETNTDRVLQVEIVGTCDRSRVGVWTGDYLRSWDLPDWAVRDLAVFAAWIRDEHGVPLVAPERWPAYPDSYGATSARLPGKTFDEYRGFLGHLHVPENTHGDPGDLDIDAVLETARNGGSMALTKDDANTVWERDCVSIQDYTSGTSDATRRPVDPDNPTWAPKSVLAWLYRAGDRLTDIALEVLQLLKQHRTEQATRHGEVSQRLDALADVVESIRSGGTLPVDTVALVEAVADELDARARARLTIV